MAAFTELTLAQYVSLVKGYMAEDREDDDNELFSDDDIKLALNAAQVDVVRIISSTFSFFRKTTSVNAATGNISLPSDYLAGMSATLVTGSSDLDRRPLTFQTSGWMDENYPFWRGMAAIDYPQYLVQQFASSGFSLVLYPQPTATITNGLFLNYVVNPDVMSAEDDESPIMARFPELQHTLLPAGALKILLFFEGGEADEQWKKWDAIFMRDIKRMRMAINTMFTQRATYGRGY
jgi:hypothetical protein